MPRKPTKSVSKGSSTPMRVAKFGANLAQISVPFLMVMLASSGVKEIPLQVAHVAPHSHTFKETASLTQIAQTAPPVQVAEAAPPSRNCRGIGMGVYGSTNVTITNGKVWAVDCPLIIEDSDKVHVDQMDLSGNGGH